MTYIPIELGERTVSFQSFGERVVNRRGVGSDNLNNLTKVSEAGNGCVSGIDLLR
jgi:hypothetical protein